MMVVVMVVVVVVIEAVILYVCVYARCVYVRARVCASTGQPSVPTQPGFCPLL